MSRHIMRKPKTLPSRFPIGTKFVIEGKRAGEGKVQVFNRYIEFPDGTLLRLPKRPDKTRSPTRSRARKPVSEPVRPASR
jgi:hypothetical protein